MLLYEENTGGLCTPTGSFKSSWFRRKKMFGWGGGGITKFTDYNYPSGNYTDSSYRFQVMLIGENKGTN